MRETELNGTKTQVCFISNGKYVLYSLPSLRILISTITSIFPVLLHVTTCAGNQNTEQYFLLKRDKVTIPISIQIMFGLCQLFFLLVEKMCRINKNG